MDDFDFAEEPLPLPTKLAPGKRGRGAGGAGGGRGKKCKTGENDDDDDAGMNQMDCFVCPQPRKRGKKWCEKHNTAFDNMWYQAENTKPPKVDLLNSTLAHPSTASHAMEGWEIDNPSSAKFKRKK